MSNTLLQNFFTETSSTFSRTNTENFSCEIRLNPEHPVYKGHFEQTPVAPGVCLTQMIKEILMQKLGKDLFMMAGDNIKFLAMINPNETPELTISFTVKTNGDQLDVSAAYSRGAVSYVKFKGKFKLSS